MMLTPLSTYRRTGIVSAETGSMGGEGGSGSQIGAILGLVAAVGLAYFTGGTSLYAYMAYASIGLAVGSFIGSIIDPVKPKKEENTPQSGIKDLYVTSAALGQMIPILYGTYRIPGNIIQAGKKTERTVFTTIPGSEGGGIDPLILGAISGAALGAGSKLKGGGTDVQIVTSKAYNIVLGIALCEGPIKAIKRIWTDLDLFYDSSSDLGHLRYHHETDDTINFVGVNDSVIQIIVYKGTETQEPDGTLNNLIPGSKGTDPVTGEPIEGTVVSAYRGTAYASIANLDLGASGRVPNFTFEVVRDHTAVERPVDLALGAGGGLYVVFTKDLTPQQQTLRYSGLYVQFCENEEFNFNYIFHKLPNGDPDYTHWGAMGFVVGVPVTIEGALIASNNGTFMLTEIAGNVMVFDKQFAYDVNQVDMTQAKAPLDTKNRLGVLRSYQTPFLQEASSRDTGMFSRHVALANMNGGANDISFVDSSGSVDGVDAKTDVGYVFVDGASLGDPNGGPLPLRDSGEIGAGTKIGVDHVSSNGDRYFYVCLEEAQALEVFDAAANVFARAALASKPTESVWSPLGGGAGYVYVLREGDVVTRLSGDFALSFIEDIAVGGGAGVKAYGHILRASSNRVWVTNAYVNTVSHFTTAGDVGTVSVMVTPSALTEARDGSIWVASFDRGEVCRIDPATYVVQTFELPDIMTSLAPATGSKVWAVASATRSAIYLVDTDGTYDMLTLPYGATKVVGDTSGAPSRDGYAYVMCETSNTVVSVTPDCNRFFAIDSGAGLARCVEDLSIRAGLSPDRIDTSGLINNQVNFIVSEVASAKDTLSLLAETFLFTFVESEGYIRYFHNYAVATVAEISENTLAGGIDKEDQKSLGVSRLQERELPTKVSVTYVSAERNYQDRAEVVMLTSGNIEQNPQVYRYPFAMTTEDAYQLAEIRLFEPWAQRERVEFTLPPLFMVLDPGDAVQVSARDISYNIHISEMTRARTWLNTVRGVTTYPPTFPEAEAVAALRTPRTLSGSVPRQLGMYQATIPTPGKNVPIMDPNHPGIALSIPGTGIINLQNPSRMAIILIDPPALSPTDIVLRSYLGTYRVEQAKDFSQATLYRSPNGTIDFSYAGTDATESTAGIAQTALASVVNPYVWDDVNTVDIQMLHGSLRMISDMDALSGQNRAMLGQELLQFARPTLIAPGVYRLSKLLRGRLGTQAFTGTHAVGEAFVLLDANTLRDTYLYERAIVDRAYFYRTIDSVTSLTSAETFEVTLHGNSLKPWAPVLKSTLRVGDNVQFNWLYRSRLNPDLVDYGGIAWDVDFTRQFQIVIYTSGFTAVQQVYTTPVFPGSAENTLSFVYSGAEQIADFGSLQAEVYYGIAGLGAQNVLGYESRSSG